MLILIILFSINTDVFWEMLLNYSLICVIKSKLKNYIPPYNYIHIYLFKFKTHITLGLLMHAAHTELPERKQ